MKKRYIIIPLLGICLCACSNAYELHDANQLKYIKDNYQNIDKYTKGASVSADINPVLVKLSKQTQASGLLVYETEHRPNEFSFQIKANATAYNIYNSKMGVSYTWEQIIAGKTVKKGTYRTANTFPRILSVGGVKNVRDLGFDKIIAQGQIYRGGEFDYLNNSGTAMKKNITADGINTLSDNVFVKTDLDLRFYNETIDEVSPLGENVHYVHCPLVYTGSENILTYKNDQDPTMDNPSNIKKVFETLGNPQSYPVYFHCAKGKDRTGCISYLIKALMGQKEEDIYKDYLWTNFQWSDGVNMDSILNTYVATIKATEGATLKEKVNNYLVNTIGVEQEDIDTMIRMIKY